MGWDGMGMNTDVTLLSLPVLSRIQEKERTDSERNGKVKVAASFDATRSLAHGILRFSLVWKSPRLTAAVEREGRHGGRESGRGRAGLRCRLAGRGRRIGLRPRANQPCTFSRIKP